MDTEQLDAIFLDACSGLPVTESELPTYATKLRQMVCSKLLEEYATNLAGSIDELLTPEEECPPDGPDSPVAPEEAVPDPAPIVQGESPPPNPV